MEVILLEEIDGLGRRGDKVAVSARIRPQLPAPRQARPRGDGRRSAVFMESERVKKSRHGP